MRLPTQTTTRSGTRARWRARGISWRSSRWGSTRRSANTGRGSPRGQLQRLAIARAVCSGAPIMVLDEVTSALDGKTEADVLANIAALPGRTVFVAAHRAKAREFATMRLRVDGGVVSAV